VEVQYEERYVPFRFFAVAATILMEQYISTECSRVAQCAMDAWPASEIDREYSTGAVFPRAGIRRTASTTPTNFKTSIQHAFCTIPASTADDVSD
jgi:hypothetical protein